MARPISASLRPGNTASSRAYKKGDNDPGVHGLRVAHHGARWLQGAQQGPMGWLQRAHRNDTEKSVCGRPKIFFFWRSHQNPEKTVDFSSKTFFFGDHMTIRTKLWKFSVKTFFFWRSHENPDKTVAFSPSVLEFTKSEMRII